MADNLMGQRRPDPIGTEHIAINSNVYSVVGTTATKLTAPAGAKLLILQADQNGFRVRLGDYVSSGMPSAEFPAASVSDGTGAVYLTPGTRTVMSAPTTITVKGYAAGSVLTYWWV